MLHCQRSSKLVVICVVLLLFVLFYVLFVFLSSYILHTEHIDSASAFQATGRQQLGCIIPHSVKHSIALLRMGKKLPETCWADWNINKLLLLHLVFLTLFLHVSIHTNKKRRSLTFCVFDGGEPSRSSTLFIHTFHSPSRYLTYSCHRPATTWVHYTTCCKTQSCAPEDGQKIARNMLS